MEAPRAVLRAEALAEWNADQPPAAVTYDPRLAPRGGRILAAAIASRRTTVLLGVTGLQPDRTYGAHVHTRPCGATGAAAGPHYQDVPDPVQPSVDPRYANPENEVWLDFTTDTGGRGWAMSQVSWEFRSGRAHSVVLHEHATSSRPGEAGMAGARIGCLTLPF